MAQSDGKGHQNWLIESNHLDTQLWAQPQGLYDESRTDVRSD